MSGQPIPVGAQAAPDPGPIFETATGFMRAKHLFMAGELGVFEVLADGGKSLDQLARDLGLPRRTARIIVDAVTALGFLEREGDRYRNAEVAQTFLSGRGPQDMRPFIRFWNRLSYRRWLTLEDSVRLGRGVSGEFNFTPDEQRIFSEGWRPFPQVKLLLSRRGTISAATAASWTWEVAPARFSEPFRSGTPISNARCTSCRRRRRLRGEGSAGLLLSTGSALSRETSSRIPFPGVTMPFLLQMSCTRSIPNRTSSCSGGSGRPRITERVSCWLICGPMPRTPTLSSPL